MEINNTQLIEKYFFALTIYCNQYHSSTQTTKGGFKG